MNRRSPPPDASSPAATAPTTGENPSFEAAIKRLTEIVQTLERGVRSDSLQHGRPPGSSVQLLDAGQQPAAGADIKELVHLDRTTGEQKARRGQAVFNLI